MIETVVHVTTLEQWKAVLDVWFKQGYEWCAGGKEYHEDYFNSGSRGLWLTEDNMISMANTAMHDCIEYSEFISKQKEDNKMATYYVTQKQLDLIDDLKESDFPVYKFYGSNKYQPLAVANNLSSKAEKMLLRYLGGDTSVEFKVKETLYRLWRIDDNGDTVYMKFNGLGTPDWTGAKDYAFTAPLEEIKRHKTISWEIEEVEE